MLAHALAVMGREVSPHPSSVSQTSGRAEQKLGERERAVFSICRQIGTLLRGKGRIMDFLPFPRSPFLLLRSCYSNFHFNSLTGFHSGLLLFVHEGRQSKAHGDMASSSGFKIF